jgi:hypothetical protein
LEFFTKGVEKMSERIMTRHPEKKNGVNIQRDKYEQMRAAIEDALEENGAQTFQALNESVGQKLEGNFDGSIG